MPKVGGAKVEEGEEHKCQGLMKNSFGVKYNPGNKTNSP